MGGLLSGLVTPDASVARKKPHAMKYIIEKADLLKLRMLFERGEKDLAGLRRDAGAYPKDLVENTFKQANQFKQELIERVEDYNAKPFPNEDYDEDGSASAGPSMETETASGPSSGEASSSASRSSSPSSPAGRSSSSGSSTPSVPGQSALRPLSPDMVTIFHENPSEASASTDSEQRNREQAFPFTGKQREKKGGHKQHLIPMQMLQERKEFVDLQDGPSCICYKAGKSKQGRTLIKPYTTKEAKDANLQINWNTMQLRKNGKTVGKKQTRDVLWIFRASCPSLDDRDCGLPSDEKKPDFQQRYSTETCFDQTSASRFVVEERPAVKPDEAQQSEVLTLSSRRVF